MFKCIREVAQAPEGRKGKRMRKQKDPATAATTSRAWEVKVVTCKVKEITQAEHWEHVLWQAKSGSRCCVAKQSGCQHILISQKCMLCTQGGEGRGVPKTMQIRLVWRLAMSAALQKIIWVLKKKPHKQFCLHHQHTQNSWPWRCNEKQLGFWKGSCKQQINSELTKFGLCEIKAETLSCLSFHLNHHSPSGRDCGHDRTVSLSFYFSSWQPIHPPRAFLWLLWTIFWTSRGVWYLRGTLQAETERKK